jgi:hypothetical protein
MYQLESDLLRFLDKKFDARSSTESLLELFEITHANALLINLN